MCIFAKDVGALKPPGGSNPPLSAMSVQGSFTNLNRHIGLWGFESRNELPMSQQRLAQVRRGRTKFL
ncbi:MAG: hypothetical protein RL094_783 [Candidatus Parcubacteria bacterium]